MKRLGFVGVGAMGGRMVPNLIRAGFEVSVVDVSPEAVRRAGASGSTISPPWGYSWARRICPEMGS